MEAPIGKLGVLNDLTIQNGDLVIDERSVSNHGGNKSSCNVAATNTFASRSSNSSSSSDDDTCRLQSTSAAFRKGTKQPKCKVTASLRELMTTITMDDEGEEIIGNLEVRHFIEQSFLNDKLAADLRWQATLLASIPGCGKSRMMRSCAVDVAKLIKKPVSVFNVTAGDLLNKYYGQSEKSPKILYAMARAEAPSIITIDEIDGVMRARSEGETDQSRRFKTSLLAQMQGVQPHVGVLTICATNRGSDLDGAFVRRFDKIFCLELPTKEQRIQIFQKFLKMFQQTVSFDLNQIDYNLLSHMTEGYTGDDIKKVVALAAYRNCKILVNGKLETCDNIETFRDFLEKSTNSPRIIPVGLQTCHLAQAAKEVRVTYKMNDLREMTKFKRDYRLGSGFSNFQCTENQVIDYRDSNIQTQRIPASSDSSNFQHFKHQVSETNIQPNKDTAQSESNDETYNEDFCGCLDKICNPC